MKPIGLGGLPLQFMSGLFSGALATALSCPADVLKSRLQNATPGQYANMLDCAGKLLKFEVGINTCIMRATSVLWKG